MPNRDDIEREWLYEQYIVYQRSAQDIARELSMGETTVYRALREHGIPIRSRSDASTLALNGSDLFNLLSDRNWLYQQYIVFRKSIHQIAEEMGISGNSIERALIRHDIPRRNLSEAGLLSQSNHVNLSPLALEFLNGELLGDGCLFPDTYSARYQHGNKHYDYLVWLSDILAGFGIRQVGNINTKHSRGVIAYSYSSSYYRELKPLYDLWYKDRIKIIPRGLVLTPLTVRQWYIGDGSLSANKSAIYRSQIVLNLACMSFTVEEIDWLASELQAETGCPFRMQKNKCLWISFGHVQNFLDYIGPCPREIEHIYGYKWDTYKGLRGGRKY